MIYKSLTWKTFRESGLIFLAISDYFNAKSCCIDEKKFATFRGRSLNGVKQQFPDGYFLYIAVEKKNKSLQLIFFSL